MPKYIIFVVDLKNKKSISESVICWGWKDAILEVLNHINANDELIQIAKSEESIENIKDRFIEKEFILDVVEVFR